MTKNPFNFIWKAGFFFFLFSTNFLFAQNILAQTNDPKAESPHFIIKTGDVESESFKNIALPLIQTKADVNIAGVIADVTVTQTYVNSGTRPIEAIYVFPGSSKSAVYGMQMQIGERIIKAKIEEKQKAKKQYEEAKEAGKSASLLEQHRPNVFQMNVANILPGDTIEVQLNYNEVLVPKEGIYEFVYPAVVGPRYGYNQTEENWAGNPYTNKETFKEAANTHSFDMDIHLEAGLDIAAAKSNSHDINIDYLSSTIADIRLNNPDGLAGTNDFILQYKLAGKQIESGLLLYEGEKENFFLMMMQPPERVLPEQIPPREYIFIVDVSGSMKGFPIDISKSLMRKLFSSLRPEDKFNVLLFAGSSDVFSSESVPANKQNINRALKLIDDNKGGGGTEVLPALKRALNLPTASGFSRNIVIATDGLVTVEREAFDLIRTNLGEANFFPFGIGRHNNRFMIEGMAHAAQTEPIMVTTQTEAQKAANSFQQFISSPVLTDIDINFENFNIYDVEPLSTPDIFAEQPVIVFGKYKGDANGKITVNGVSGKSPYSMALNVNDYESTNSNSALRYLWARQKIMMLSDYEKLDRVSDKKVVKEITQLGLDYNLLTDYTSFIAIDSEQRVEQVKEANAQKDKDNPALAANSSKPAYSTGSSNSSSNGAVPEPHEWALIVLLLMMTTFLMVKNKF